MRASLGKGRIDSDDLAFDDEWLPLPEDKFETEHQARLSEILAKGEAGTIRSLLGPRPDAQAAIDGLVDRAPHLTVLGAMAAEWMRAASVIGLPAKLPPVLLRGEPGAGKSWFVSKLAQTLGLPHCRYSMAGSSLADSMQGSHPIWRNAGPGLVAKTLLMETAANAVIMVDEFDKVGRVGFDADPYRAFYSLLDPSDSHNFSDEYLGFPIDASHVIWIMAANAINDIPTPILDRLIVLDVPDMDRDQRRRVSISIYTDANIAMKAHFDPTMSASVLDRLDSMSPRSMRKAVDGAMIRAAAEGRRSIRADDIRETSVRARRPYGFLPGHKCADIPR